MSHFELFLLQDIDYCYHRLQTRPKTQREHCSKNLLSWPVCILPARPLVLPRRKSYAHGRLCERLFHRRGPREWHRGEGHARFIEADARKCAEVSCCSTPDSAHRCRCQRAVAFRIEGCALDRSRAVTPKAPQNRCQTTGKCKKYTETGSENRTGKRSGFRALCL